MHRRLSILLVIAMAALAYMPTAEAAGNDTEAPVVCIYHGPSITDIRIRLMSNCGPGGYKFNVDVQVDEDGIRVCIDNECVIDFAVDGAPSLA